MLIGDISDDETEREELSQVLGNRYDLWYQFKELYVIAPILTDDETNAITASFGRTNSPTPTMPEHGRRHSSVDIRPPPSRKGAEQPPEQSTRSENPPPKGSMGPNERFFKPPWESDQFDDLPRPLQRSSSMPLSPSHQRPPLPPRNFANLTLDDIPPSATATTEDSDPYSDDCATNTSKREQPFAGGDVPLKGEIPMEEVGKSDYARIFGGLVFPDTGHG
jgi:hypothetical protein